LKPLLKQLKKLECNGKDERVATLRSELEKLAHCNRDLMV